MLWVVIMAGGSGTRFWPESRQRHPKQFLRFFNQKTLLEETVSRFKQVVDPSRILIVTQEDKVSLVRKLVKGIPSSQILGEPVGRNTAPCAALAASLVLRKDPKAVIVLSPADHTIQKIHAFVKAVKAAHKIAEKSCLPVTFGIKPAFPHTGYGYLELGRFLGRAGGIRVYRLKRFHEKPVLAKAKRFYRSGKFLWNGGMFIWKAEECLKATKKYLPRIYHLTMSMTQRNFRSRFKRSFARMPSVSIDYGLMEKMKGQILTMQVEFDWSDVGGWQSFYELHQKDRNRNVTMGPCLMIDSSGNLVRSQKRFVTLLHVHNHVVIETPDAILVCPRDKTEDIRKIVKTLKNMNQKQYL